MCKLDLIKTVETSMLLGRILATKEMIPDSFGPLANTIGGSADMLAAVILDKLLGSTDLTREDFAENLAAYEDIKDVFDLLEKLKGLRNPAE